MTNLLAMRKAHSPACRSAALRVRLLPVLLDDRPVAGTGAAAIVEHP
jgi:hypothetical protein